MGLSANLFYDSDNEVETLFSRVSLTKEQIEDARSKKDTLLEYLKPEMSSALDVRVKHWLQGSYKNHTLIRPARKGEEFDIDVGIYVLLNAEEEGLDASDVKGLNRQILEWFARNKPETQVDDSKSNCERLCYPSSFHIDVPLYYFDAESNECKLATQDNGWVDSDPKALQDWFDEKASKYDANQLARLRRVIKYLKAWTALNSEDERAIPSIAITVLVAYYYSDFEDDDDAFIYTAIPILEYILGNDTLPSPINGDDLLGFGADEREQLVSKAEALKNLCEFVKDTKDSIHQFVLWSGTFKYLFPPLSDQIESLKQNTNLPAITTPPRIRIRHLNKSDVEQSNRVAEEVRVYRDEKLYFSLENADAYRHDAEVHWMVRNKDNEAKRFNDLGHTTVSSLHEECFESCSYKGCHYMECLVLVGGEIAGIGSVRVRIAGFSRPVRNPPRKRYFKGR